ncbi:DUF3313 domain-containing protein [Desulfolutivibrio sp.]|uniref:DUF3313 domain-containing protein n=1 Tax=Desulfolutivibrio sp. TaxID=2773296 RepID=UPI002F969404
MTISWRRLFFVLLALTLCAGAGCKSMKAKPSAGAGFVPMDQMANREDLPFQKVWVKSGAEWKKYTTLYIAKVNTSYLMNSTWWQQSVRSADMQKDVAEVAAYMRDAFRKAFAADANNRFRIVDAPTPDSLTLELAMTELVPSHVVMEALSLVAPYGSGVAVQAAAKGSESKCTVAFEAKIINSKDRQVLAMAADREQGKVAPINLNALTWYGEARVIIDEWAGQFVQIANRRPGEAVKDSSPFTLSPW